jgi:hypothetical protein
MTWSLDWKLTAYGVECRSGCYEFASKSLPREGDLTDGPPSRRYNLITVSVCVVVSIATDSQNLQQTLYWSASTAAGFTCPGPGFNTHSGQPLRHREYINDGDGLTIPSTSEHNSPTAVTDVGIRRPFSVPSASPVFATENQTAPLEIAPYVTSMVKEDAINSCRKD